MGRNAVIGLDIGTSAVRAAEVDVKKTPPVLLRFGQVMLPIGSVRDGEIIDEPAVGATLAELWKRAGFKSKRVIVGVANQRVIVRQVEMPYMSESDLQSGLAYQVQDQLPIPVEDAILDFQILDEFPGPDNERLMRVLLVAAQREMVDALLRTLDHANLRPDVIDLVPFALLRTLGLDNGFEGFQPVDAYGQPRRGAEAIIDVGGGITNIVVHEHGLPRFVRILVAGGQHVTDALAAQGGMTLEDAEVMKRQAAFGGVPDEAVKLIDDRTRTILDEVRGSLDYYAAQPESAPLARVVVTGGGAHMPDFVGRLASTTGVPTELGHPLAGVRLGSLGLSPEQLAEAESMMAVTVGLALGERK